MRQSGRSAAFSGSFRPCWLCLVHTHARSFSRRKECSSRDFARQSGIVHHYQNCVSAGSGEVRRALPFGFTSTARAEFSKYETLRLIMLLFPSSIDATRLSRPLARSLIVL